MVAAMTPPAANLGFISEQKSLDLADLRTRSHYPELIGKNAAPAYQNAVRVVQACHQQ
jgi:hypothetical protein